MVCLLRVGSFVNTFLTADTTPVMAKTTEFGKYEADETLNGWGAGGEDDAWL